MEQDSLQETQPHAHEWVTSVALVCIGVLGVMNLQILMFGWRVGGVGPIDRRTFGGALLLLVLGGWLALGEGRRRCIIRRWLLCCAIGSAPLLHAFWRSGSTQGSWGWLALLACGLCAGGEIVWIVRALRFSVPYDPVVRVKLCLFVIASIVFPSMWMPYVGVLPGSVFYAFLVILWGTWKCLTKRESFRWGLAFGLVFGMSLGIAGVVPGIFESTKGFLPVDISGPISARQTLRLETSKNLRQLLVTGFRWEFLSSDAHRWAEALVHPAMSTTRGPVRVLLLGGETGMALREILRYPNVQKVEVWTPFVHRVAFFREQPLLSRLHQNSFSDRRVSLLPFSNLTALFSALRKNHQTFDRIFIQLDQPWVEPVWTKTYRTLFQMLRGQLTEQGLLGFLWGDLKPLSNYACTLHAIRQAGWKVRPYRSLGSGVTWGLGVASKSSRKMIFPNIPHGLRYLSQVRMEALFAFPHEQSPKSISVSDCVE